MPAHRSSRLVLARQELVMEPQLRVPRRHVQPACAGHELLPRAIEHVQVLARHAASS